MPVCPTKPGIFLLFNSKDPFKNHLAFEEKRIPNIQNQLKGIFAFLPHCACLKETILKKGKLSRWLLKFHDLAPLLPLDQHLYCYTSEIRKKMFITKHPCSQQCGCRCLWCLNSCGSFEKKQLMKGGSNSDWMSGHKHSCVKEISSGEIAFEFCLFIFSLLQPFLDTGLSVIPTFIWEEKSFSL